MRITFDATHRSAQEGIARAAERMQQFQRQVSTGLRVERASDDPSAMATAIGEQAAVASYDQYVAAADAAGSRLEVADSVLNHMLEMLTAAQANVLTASGTTPTAAQRAAIAADLRSLRDALLSDVNTSFRGTYLFGGASGTTKPFDTDAFGVVQPYAGSAREVDVDINRGRAVTVAFDGSQLAQGGDAVDIFTVFESAATATTAADSAALADAMAAMGRAFDRVTRMQSQVGASMKAVEDHTVQLGDASRASGARIAKLVQADMPEAISGMQESQVTYEAALGAAARTLRMSLFDYI